MAISFLRVRLLIFVGLVGLFLGTFWSLFNKSDDSKLDVVLRYDDFSSTSSERVENLLYSLIDLNDISCSFGIIPFHTDTCSISQNELIPLSDSKIGMIRSYVKEGSVEVSLHGYVHQSTSRSGNKSEFRGISEEKQIFMISSGRDFLDSVFMTNVLTFIPPWNNYDYNTIKVLSDQEFKNISADNLRIFEQPYNFNYVPYTALITDFDEILERNRLPLRNNRACVVVMLHDYDFAEINKGNAIISIQAFNKILERIIGKGWEVLSIRDAVDKSGSFDYKRYKWNYRKLYLIEHLSVLSGIFGKINMLKAFYLSAGQVIRILMLVILFYLLIALLVGEGTYWLLITLSIKWNFLRFLLIPLIILILLSVFIFLRDDNFLGKYELSFIMMGSGVIVGLLYYRIGLHKHNKT